MISVAEDRDPPVLVAGNRDPPRFVLGGTASSPSVIPVAAILVAGDCYPPVPFLNFNALSRLLIISYAIRALSSRMWLKVSTEM